MTRYLFPVLLMIGVAGGSVQAQSLDDLRSNTLAYYKFADPTDITIEVHVWGAVSNPGLYEVRQGIRLRTLLSLAGGPQVTGRTSGTSRTLTLRLSRPQPGGGPHQTLFEAQMENEILVLDQDPVLLSGDTVVAEEWVIQRFGWRDGLSVLSVLGTIALLVERLVSPN